MLGDGGGRHLEAVGNVGVTPGQVGIGLCGGEHIRVENNVMYSAAWPDSNIAFYSCNYSRPAPCGHHAVIGNRANWLNRDGKQNTFWTDRTTGKLTVKDNRFPDRTVTEEIWEQWEKDVRKAARKHRESQ